jgi:hypothetical protein
MYQTMRGPVRLSGQEANNANNGIFPPNYEEENRQRRLQHQLQHDLERQHDPEYQHRLQQEHQRQRRREYRQRLSQKRQQQTEINNNNNFEYNSTNFGSVRTKRSNKAKYKRSGLELERL